MTMATLERSASSRGFLPTPLARIGLIIPSTNRLPDPKLKLLPVDIMNPAIVWLASKRSDGKTGGRYIGRLWNDKLPPDEAAAGAFTPPALRMTGD